MAKRELRPYFDRCLAALAIIFALSTYAHADPVDEREEVYDPNGLVEVHIKTDPNSSYSEKKTNWSYRFSMDYEAFYPSSYISQADGASYQTIFGNNQGFFATASFGMQYNTRIGGFYVDAQYGGGSIAGGPGTTGGMSVSKYGATIGYSLNTLQKDPGISPYLAMQVVYIGWNEAASGNSGVAAPALGTILGVSFHLNKFDSDAAKVAYQDYGIINTAFDIYAVQYATSSDASDPDFQTTFNVGAGFHFEF